jgi:hypothetical protein
LSGSPCLDPPAWLPDARQYFARFVVEEVKVEISTVESLTDTDTFECFGRGPGSTTFASGLASTLFPLSALSFGWPLSWSAIAAFGAARYLEATPA